MYARQMGQRIGDPTVVPVLAVPCSRAAGVEQCDTIPPSHTSTLGL